MKAKIQPYFDKQRCNLSEEVPLDTPFTLIIQPSTVCNVRCKYCLQSVSDEEKKARNFNCNILDFDLFLKILDQIKEFPKKIKDISFTGMGEPLINKNLPKMIKLIKEADVAERVQFFTNGLLLSKKISDELIDSGLDELRISLQGLTAEKYYEICGAKMNYSHFIDNIRYFYENKGSCKLYIKIADIAMEGSKEEFYNMFGNICDKMFIEKIVPLFDGVDYSNVIDNKVTQNKYKEELDCYDVCPNCFYTLNINPIGNVLPCCGVYDTPLGNVNKNSLFELWNSEQRKKFLFMQLKKEKDKDLNCKNCFVPNNQQKEDNLDSSCEKIIAKLKLE